MLSVTIDSKDNLRRTKCRTESVYSVDYKITSTVFMTRLFDRVFSEKEILCFFESKMSQFSLN